MGHLKRGAAWSRVLVGLALAASSRITSPNLLLLQLLPRRDDHIPDTNGGSRKALICRDWLRGAFPWPQMFLQLFISNPWSGTAAERRPRDGPPGPTCGQGLVQAVTKVLRHPRRSAVQTGGHNNSCDPARARSWDSHRLVWRTGTAPAPIPAAPRG